MQVAVAVNDNMGAKKKYISDNKTAHKSAYTSSSNQN